MARTLKSDKLLFSSTLLLVCASAIMVYSASAVTAQAKYHVAYYFLFRQLAYAAAGVGLMLVAMRVDYHHYKRPAVIWSVLGIVVVGLLAVFLFGKTNGTRRWIAVSGFSAQPSELAKLAIIIFTSALLEQRMHRVNDLGYALLPVGLVTAALAGLIVLEPDFGTAVMLVLIAGAILFAAGLSYRYLVMAFVTLLPFALVLVLGSAYRRERILSFLNPWKDSLGSGYQAIQSLIAVGSGGAVGKGLLAGMQNLSLLPEAHTDYIFAVIGEEFGLVGTTLVVCCFAVIVWRGLRTSLVAADRFGALLALGLTAMIGVQALFNMSVVTALLPSKGIPLPFVSNGGSSLLVNLIGMGILLNISQQSSSAAAIATLGEPTMATLERANA